MALKIKDKVIHIKKPKKESDVMDESSTALVHAVGLVYKFESVNLMALHEGYETGSIETTCEDDVYHVTLSLADKSLNLTIESADFHEIIADTPIVTESANQSFTEVKNYINSFISGVLIQLHGVQVSPTMQLIASTWGTASQSDTEAGIPFTATLESTPELVKHVCHEFECDPEIGAKDLEKATQLYEPVFGTSNGSRYHCIMITTDGAKLAARYKNGSLGLKIVVPSGAPYDACKQHLSDFGFALKSGGHLSVHFQSISQAVAQRTIAAVLSGFDPETVLTGTPVLSKFEKHGS